MIYIAKPTPDTLGLYFGHELQGSYFTNGDVTPVSANQYHCGWLIAGERHPNDEVLMVGLGSGAGIVALLTNFPMMTCTCVEPLPEVVRTALQAFAPLRDLVDNGRLQIVLNTAEAFLEKSERYPLILCDAYQGKDGYICETAYIEKALAKGDAVWLNVIGAPSHGAIPQVLDLMDVMDRPARSAYCIQPGFANWLISTEDFKKSSFVPYPDSSVPQVATVRKWYNALARQDRLALLK